MVSMTENGLPKKMGFRSRNPNAMTDAERQQKARRNRGTRQLQLALDADVSAAILYIRKEWGIESNREACQAAIRFLALCTRQGLQRLPQTIDD
jgi:hypothetical protein